MQLRSLSKAKNLAGKTVLVRVDYNVQLTTDKKIAATELYKLKRTLPTITLLREQGVRIVLTTHLGRPGGVVDPNLSTKPLAHALAKILDTPVMLLHGASEPEVKRKIARLKPGQVAMLENIRFYPGEDENDQSFAAILAEGFDFFVQDAFAVVHRTTATTVGVTAILPTYAGLLLEEEMISLNKYIVQSKKPTGVLLGGAKAKTKLPFIQSLLPRVECILLGGVLANTFLAGIGKKVGQSIIDSDFVDMAGALAENEKIRIPVDVVCDDTNTTPVESLLRTVDQVQQFDKIIDIGTETAIQYASWLRSLETVFVNGPLGFIEQTAGCHGSIALARFVAALSATGRIISVVGGGETIQVFSKAGVLDDVTYVSTGGGAMFAYLLDQQQPGIVPVLLNE